mgnify:CR=1 FL=1
MRIISGFLKGKSINFLKNLNTRPLKDSVKENIFNILKHSNLINVKIENSNILDLFSGIGSFGLECISNGAKKVTFIEQDKNAANILTENLIKLSVISKALVINKKIENILKENVNEKFDIFFFDPPFADKKFITIIDIIKRKKIYKTKHVVIIHRESKTEDGLENFINPIFTKSYGRSKIIFGIFS